jgi:hypothetical protein
VTLRRVPRPQKRPHDETLLLLAIGVLGPDRASPPRPASCAHAVRAGRVLKMACACGDVVAGGRERADRTRVQAPAPFAGLTWTGDCFQFGNIQRLPKPERPAIAVPEPASGMDQETDRRGMHRLRTPRPLLERPEWRPAEGEKRRRAKVARQTFDQPSAPAVERMLGASAASGLAAKASQPERPAMPASTIVHTSASAPRCSSSERRKAPRGTRPVRSIAEDAVSSPAPLIRIVFRAGRDPSSILHACRRY